MGEYKADADAKMAEYKADADAKITLIMSVLVKVAAARASGIPTWPGDTSELRVGVNDTWNAFQYANKGRSVSTAEWKTARAKLLAESNGAGSSGSCSGSRGASTIWTE
jgi:hypothetical protein